MKQWIHSPDAGNQEYLESIGVTLGERSGEYWHNCTIPEEAAEDMLEHWGDGIVGFGPEEGPARAKPAAKRIKETCGDCGCNLRIDGTCSYPLCEPPRQEQGQQRRRVAKLRL